MSAQIVLQKMDKVMQPVEMALEAAVIVMQNGGSTVAAERSFSNILSGFKENGASAIWRLDFVAARSGPEGQSSTVLRSVGPIGVNLLRASEVAVLGERVVTGEVATADLTTEIDRIKHLPAPHNRWIKMLAAAVLGMAFSQIAGGDWGSLPIAAVAAGIGYVLDSELHARKFSAAIVTLTCGVLSASLGGVGLRLGFSHVPMATLMSSVIYLAPGLPLINGFIDMISHKYLFVGLQRIANATFLFMILAIAIALAYKVIV